eukprot:COSAG01_NODE_1362_length_10565_cov_111.342156_9_plen_90_part_00
MMTSKFIISTIIDNATEAGKHVLKVVARLTRIGGRTQQRQLTKLVHRWQENSGMDGFRQLIIIHRMKIATCQRCRTLRFWGSNQRHQTR